MSPTVSPRPRPSAAKPAASFLTFSPYSPHVIENSSPLVRIATSSARSAAVTWKAPHIVCSSSARYVTRSLSLVVVAMSSSLKGVSGFGQ